MGHRLFVRADLVIDIAETDVDNLTAELESLGLAFKKSISEDEAGNPTLNILIPDDSTEEEYKAVNSAIHKHATLIKMGPLRPGRGWIKNDDWAMEVEIPKGLPESIPTTFNYPQLPEGHIRLFA
jgi:hypothetical protein